MKRWKSDNLTSNPALQIFHSDWSKAPHRFQKRFTFAIRSTLFLAAIVGAQYAGSALPMIHGEGDSLNTNSPLIIERVLGGDQQGVTVEILAQDKQRIYWDHKLLEPPYRFTTTPGAHTLTVHNNEGDPEIQLLELQGGISTFIRTY